MIRVHRRLSASYLIPACPYDKALVLKPDCAEAYNFRGNVLLDLMRLDDALASYEQSIALKPYSADAYCQGNSGAADIQCSRNRRAINAKFDDRTIACCTSGITLLFSFASLTPACP